MNLYRCPGLSAWLSLRQCDFNARLAARATLGFDARLAAVHVIGTCTSCPGVEALGAGVRELPELLQVRDARPPKLPRRRTIVPSIKTGGWKRKPK